MESINYHLELTPAQLKITHTALRSLLDDFGHDEQRDPRDHPRGAREAPRRARDPRDPARRRARAEQPATPDDRGGPADAACPAPPPERRRRLSLSVQIGLLLALATAFASVLGFLYKHRGAVESPAVELRRPVRTSLALFRSRWYTLGIVIAMAGWGLHVGALSLAPISLVQSVIAGGLVLLTVTADRLFAHEVTRREWVGVGARGARARLPRGDARGRRRRGHSDYETARLVVYLVSSASAARRRRRRRGRRGRARA